MAIVGLKNFYFATLIKDDESGITYEDPIRLPKIISADITPSSNSATLYADDGPCETDTVLGEIAVSIEISELSLEHQAALLGHTVEKGVMTQKGEDTAPYVAIMFESKKSNGKKRYAKLLKGKFQVPKETTKTKDNNITYQTAKLEGKFVMRQYDDAWKRIADEDAEGYELTTGAAWYESVEPKPVPTE